MDAVQLKSFVAVAHEGNLTQAAKRLFLSQPAVSAQIKALEEYVGTPLHQGRHGERYGIDAGGRNTVARSGIPAAIQTQAGAFCQNAGRRPGRDQFGHYPPHRFGKTRRADGQYRSNSPQNALLHIQYGMSGEILSRIQHKTLHGGFILQRRPTHPQRIPAKPELRSATNCPTKPEKTNTTKQRISKSG